MRRFIATLWLALVLLSGSSLLAQTPAYQDAWQIGSSGNDRGMAIATDINGNVYSTGHFTGMVDFDRGPGVANRTAGDTGDVYVAKYDSEGNFIWAFRVGGIGTVQAATGAVNSGVSIAVDGTGDIVVMGYFAGAADFDPGAGITTRTARTGKADTFLARYTSAGSLAWVFSLPVEIELQYSKQNCLDIDTQGNIVIGGQFAGSVDFNPGSGKRTLTSASSSPQWYSDIFVAKYTSGGSLVWANRLGNSGWETVQAVGFDRNDNVLVTGIFGFGNTSALNFNWGGGAKVNVTPPGRGSNYVAKYGPGGQINWAFALGNDNSMRSMGLASDDSGNVVISGYMQGTVDFNPSPTATAFVTPRILANMSIFMAKFDSMGRYRWAFATAMGWGSSLAIDAAGDILVTGNFACSGDFDPSDDSLIVYSVPNCSSNSFAAKYTSTGTLSYVFGVHGTDDSTFSHGKGLALDGSGNIYITGSFGYIPPTARSSDFDPSENIVALASAGGQDVYIAKYSEAAPPKRSVSQNVPDGHDIALHVAPNPFTGEFILTYDGASVPSRVVVLDIMGRVVETLDVVDPNQEIALGAELPTGTYIVQMIQGNARRTTLVHKVR